VGQTSSIRPRLSRYPRRGAWVASAIDDDLLRFSRRFGELDPPPNQERGRQSPPGYPDIYVVSNVLDDKGQPIGALGAGEAVWHTDMSYADLPPDASMLYALEIPPTGGNTALCGMQAAWASLPAALKRKIGGRRIKHDGSNALLDELWEQATRPEFVYEHRWRVGDLLLWDNRSTMHRRDPFDSATRRVMHRTQIKGKWPPRAYVSAA
jgi:taurine dioxygenase